VLMELVEPLRVVVSPPAEALKMALPQKMRSDLNANCFHSHLASARWSRARNHGNLSASQPSVAIKVPPRPGVRSAYS
jgi:hypothetical protein